MNCLGRNVAFFKTVIAAKWNRSKVLFDIEETFDFLVLRRNYIGVATIGAFSRYFIGLRVICTSWKKYAMQVFIIPKRKTKDVFFCFRFMTKFNYVVVACMLLFGSRCYIWLDFLRQFKSDWLWRLEGLVFEKKISFYWT